jgi:hypothetical protein
MEIYNYKLVKYTFKLFYAKILFLFEYPRLFLKLFFYPIYVFRIFSFFFFFVSSVAYILLMWLQEISSLLF